MFIVGAGALLDVDVTWRRASFGYRLCRYSCFFQVNIKRAVDVLQVNEVFWFLFNLRVLLLRVSG